MVASLCKWFILGVILLTNTGMRSAHPFYVSITQIDQNSMDKTLEITCKLFTDDLENTINKQYKTAIDIARPKDTAQVRKLVSDYLLRHLKLKINGKPVNISFIGYEREKEAVWSYLQVNDVSTVSRLDITNTLLYDAFDTQIGIIHVTVNGKRKSTKLNNPDSGAVFEF